MPLAEAGATLADEAHAHPVLATQLEGVGDTDQRLGRQRQRRHRREHAPAEVPHVEITSVHRGAPLAVLHQQRMQRFRHEHQQRAQIADQRADVVAAIGFSLAELRVATQSQGGSYDRLLTGGAKALLR